MTSVVVSARAFDRNLGGNSTYVRNVYSRIAAHGVDYQVVYPPIRVAGSRMSAIVYAAWEAVGPLACGRLAQADVVHFPTDTGGLYKSRKVSVVATIHGVASHRTQGIRSPSRQALWNARTKRMTQIADCIITDSRSSSDDLHEAFSVSKDRLAVVPLGVDHGRFNPEAATADTSRFPMPKVKRYALYLGNLEPRKNVVSLIRAFGQPQLRNLGLPLVIAGKPAWSYKAIMAEIAKSKNVHYLGPVPDDVVAPLIARSTVFVFPSLYEGFGLPVLEAMACGVPVVTTDRGALPETTGDAAWVLSGDLGSESIASAVEEVVGDPQTHRRLSAAGPKQASLFTWDATAAAHAQIFHRVGNA